jgi:PAS domain S-box-containing protein
MALSKAAMESRIREERKWLITTLRCIRDGVIAADSLGTVKLLNPAAERLTGWTECDAANRDLSEVLQALEPGTRAPSDSSVIGVITGRSEETRSRKILVSRDGTEKEVEETVAPITNEAGAMTGVVIVFHQVDAS